MKLKPVLAALLFAIPTSCMAETFICLGEAGAAVEHGGQNGIQAGLYDVSKKKYILSDVSGTWQFREPGEDASILKCLNEYYCEVEGYFSAFFFRERDTNIFTYVGVAGYDNSKRSMVYTVKGKCSSM